MKPDGFSGIGKRDFEGDFASEFRKNVLILQVFFLSSKSWLFLLGCMIKNNMSVLKNPIVRLILCFAFLTPCLAQDNPSDAQMAELFEREVSLKIREEKLKGKEIKKMGFEDDDDKTDIDYDGFVYTLDFRNSSQADFDDLKVECRFFYTEESDWRAVSISYSTSRGLKAKSEQKHQEDSLDLSLKSGERYKVETRPFILKSWSLTSGYYFTGGTADHMDADADGLWVRLYYTTPDGQKVRRDFCEPASLSSRISWEGESI